MTLPYKILFGGSFNPVHLGHARLAVEIAQALRPSSFAFVPCKAWQAKRAEIVDDQHRLAMLNALIGELNQVDQIRQTSFHLDICELDRQGNSYTVDTLRASRLAHPDCHLLWVLGMDSWLNLSQWFQWQSLTDYGSLLIVNRPGGEAVTIPREQSLWAAGKTVPLADLRDPGSIAFIDTTPLQISSTTIRSTLASGQSGKFLLPESVGHYVTEHRLYQN